jgi:hypothetical protein
VGLVILDSAGIYEGVVLLHNSGSVFYPFLRYRWLTSHRRYAQGLAIIKRANGDVRVVARGTSPSHASMRSRLSATAVMTFWR